MKTKELFFLYSAMCAMLAMSDRLRYQARLFEDEYTTHNVMLCQL